MARASVAHYVSRSSSFSWPSAIRYEQIDHYNNFVIISQYIVVPLFMYIRSILLVHSKHEPCQFILLLHIIIIACMAWQCIHAPNSFVETLMPQNQVMIPTLWCLLQMNLLPILRCLLKPVFVLLTCLLIHEINITINSARSYDYNYALTFNFPLSVYNVLPYSSPSTW